MRKSGVQNSLATMDPWSAPFLGGILLGYFSPVRILSPKAAHPFEIRVGRLLKLYGP